MQINRQTYEEFFLLYADGELNAVQKKAVEDFIEKNPDLANEFNLIRNTVLQPDESIIFENKELLYRDDEDRKIIYMRWFRMAAAAVVLIVFSVVGWLFIDNRESGMRPVAVVEKPVPVNTSTSEPVSEDKKMTDAQQPYPSNGTQPGKDSISAARSAKKSLQYVKHSSPDNDIPGPREDAIEQTQQVAVVEDKAPATDVPERALFRQTIVNPEPQMEIIDVAVKPQEMVTATGDAGAEKKISAYAQSFEEETNSSDMIYFANTSLTKKTKLRGVLRKASRYLDRVTSLQ